jgi:mediator of RNA polymerase II transcription subunit 14
MKGWKDVRILSFDLQTVEFAYYQDYAVSITSVEGNYKLSFFRCALPSSNPLEDAKTNTPHGSSMDIDVPSLPPSQSQALSQGSKPPPSQTQASQSQYSQTHIDNATWKNDPARRNPHEDSARFAQELLKDERLGPSVFDMVGFLRITVGIVEVLDVIEEDVEASSTTATPSKGKARVTLQFDVLVKATGWWRIQYMSMPLLNSTGGNRYGLDVRIINGRVMIVDGSVDLHAGKGGMKSRGGGTLMPIPKMEELVKATLEETKGMAGESDGVVAVNYGDAVICGAGGAPKILKRLHEKIMDGL